MANFLDGKVSSKAWRDMGHKEVHCEGCADLVSYPSNLASYLVVCPCGWFAKPAWDGSVEWFPPVEAEDVLQLGFDWPNRVN